MILVIVILVSVFLVFIWKGVRKGLEATLPFLAFMVVLSPLECSVALPGLFDLTVQRLMLGTLVVLHIVAPKRSYTMPRNAATALKVLILIHVLWVLLSTANSVAPVASLKMAFSMVLEYYALFLIVSKNITSTGTINSILYGMVTATIVCSAFGAVEAYSGWSVLTCFPPRNHHFLGSQVLDLDLARGLRVRSTFPHAILFGEALVMSIIWTLHLLPTARNLKAKALLWVGLSLMFLNIYKTASRGPWGALGFSLVMLFMFSHKLVRRSILSLTVMSVLVLVIRPGVWDTIAGIYDATFNLNSPVGTSYEYRWALLKVGEEALAKGGGRELWGYGLATFFDLGLRGNFLGEPDHKFLSCDSSWVELMVETGYVGLVIILILLTIPAIMALMGTWKFRMPQKHLSWVFFISIISFYYMMISVAIYGWGQNGHMLWILIALVVAYPRVVRRESAQCAVPVQAEMLRQSCQESPRCSDTIPDVMCCTLDGGA